MSDGVVMDTNMMKNGASQVKVPPQPILFCPTACPASAETPSCAGEDHENPFLNLPCSYWVLRRVLGLDMSHCTFWKLVVINLSTVSHCCESLAFSQSLHHTCLFREIARRCVLGYWWPATGGLTNTCNFYNPSPANILHPCVHTGSPLVSI